MNYHKIFKDAFSAVSMESSDESFAKSVAERKSNMESKKRISIKKPVIAICAAAAALTLGTVGAAAAGIINFNEIFGNTIRTENAELGEALIGNAENVKWTVSDENYVVNLKGVTGTNERVMAVVEIARADGMSVEDYLKNKDVLEGTILLSGSKYLGLSNPDVNLGKSVYTYVNESGNIEISYQVYLGKYDTCGITSLDGERVIYDGIGFYPASIYDGGVYLGGDYNMIGGNCGEPSEEIRQRLEELSVLNLDWSMEFDYVPSETSAKTYTVTDLSQPTYFECEVERWDDKDGDGEYEADEGEIEVIAENERFEVMFDKITVNSIGGTFSAKVNLGEYTATDLYVRPLHTGVLDIRFIKNDGTDYDVTVIVTSGTSASNFETGIMKCDYDFEYHHGGGQTAVDLSEISAISINGTVYNLE